MEKECIECGEKFILTDGEIKFYDKKGYPYPKRCKKCRNSNAFKEIGFKRNSFFNNAQIFGMPTDVAGGLYVEYEFIIICCIDNKNKYVVVDNSNDKEIIKLVNDEFGATRMYKDEAERIKKLIEKNKNIDNIRILSKSHYESIRD